METNNTEEAATASLLSINEPFKNRLYDFFFINLRIKHNISKEDFYNAKYRTCDFYKLEDGYEYCVCGVKIKNVYTISSDIINQNLKIGICCLENFEEDLQILGDSKIKKCLLCNTHNTNRSDICNECKKRSKCNLCNEYIPYKNYKTCNFCKFNIDPINKGKNIIGKYGSIPVYLKYGPYGNYLSYIDKKYNIPSFFITDNILSVENAIKIINYRSHKNNVKKII